MKIRPSTTESTVGLWVKSLLNALLFFSLFMVLLPYLFNAVLPQELPLAAHLRVGLAACLLSVGVVVWVWCLDLFSRQGRGTPFPLDAPRRLVTNGPFSLVRNPIIGAELLVIWGEVAYFATVGLLSYGVLAAIAAQAAVVYIEEPELRRRFGRRYESYCQQVPRWVPRLRRSVSRGRSRR